MASRFAELYEPMASAAIDDLYGDITRVFPMSATPGQIFGSSAAGVFYECIGIVDVNPVTVRIQDEGSNDGLTPGLVGEKYHVSYDLSVITPLGPQPKQGFEIEVEKEGIPRLRVVRVDPDGIGRIVCYCTKAGEA